MGNCDSLCISSNSRKNNKNKVKNNSSKGNNVKNNSAKGDYTFPNGDYYVGPLNNYLPNGKGKRFTPKDKIRYEGNFFNGCEQGQGKWYWDNGEYYVGEFSNGFRHGKGAIYYSNGYIKQQGIYVNDIYEGESNIGTNYKMDNKNNGRVLKNGTKKVQVDFGKENKEIEYASGYFFGDINSPFKGNQGE